MSFSSEQESQQKISIVENNKRLKFKTYLSYSSFSSQALTISGSGLYLDIDYAFKPRWAFSFAASQGLNFDSNVSALYTNISLQGKYSLSSSFLTKSIQHIYNDKTFLQFEEKPKYTLGISAGFEQFFFNTSNSTVSASGLSLGGYYEREIWNLNLSLGLKYARLLLRSKDLTMFTLLTGLYWQF